jgi:hypothetical protein
MYNVLLKLVKTSEKIYPLTKQQYYYGSMFTKSGRRSHLTLDMFSCWQL